MEFVSFADWDQLPESANALFVKAEKDSIFFSRAWFENVVNTALEDDQHMLLACVVEKESVRAILPLMKRNSEHWRSLGHLYTSLYTLLLAENAQQDILTCLVQGLRQLPAYSLRLAPVAENDSSLQSLQQVLESSGFSCHRYFRFYNWNYQLQGQSFEDYMAGRPSRVRNTIARKQRKLEREHSYNIRLFTSHNLQQAMADYNTVYAASWKVNELFGEVIEGLALSLSKRGWLRLAILYIDDQPAAAQFWFVAHGKASIFKLVYDETWKPYSPGSILTKYLMEYVIDTDKVDEIDFLTGNDAYKQDWMSERRERWGLYCGNMCTSKHKSNQFIESLKGWLKRPKEQA